MTFSTLTYGTGHKQLEFILLGQLQHVVQPLDVDPHGERNVRLAHCTEQRGEVDDPVYLLCHHNLLQVLKIQDVSIDVGAWIDKVARF